MMKPPPSIAFDSPSKIDRARVVFLVVGAAPWISLLLLFEMRLGSTAVGCTFLLANIVTMFLFVLFIKACPQDFQPSRWMPMFAVGCIIYGSLHMCVWLLFGLEDDFYESMGFAGSGVGSIALQAVGQLVAIRVKRARSSGIAIAKTDSNKNGSAKISNPGEED